MAATHSLLSEPETDIAIDFLQNWHGPAGPWTIGTIDPNASRRQQMPAVTFTDLAALRSYIERNNGRINLYFLPNKCLSSITTTPEKSEITGLVALYVDIDLPKNVTPAADNYGILLGRIQALEPKPSVVIFSGGGYQAYWLFPEPLDASRAAQAEAAGKAIAKEIRSDAVQNINRWMRLPGTVNVPNADKRARGRVPYTACVVEADWSLRWSLGVDPAPKLPQGFYGDDAGDSAHNAAHAFADLPTRWQKAIKSGNVADYDGDRSRLVFAICHALIRRGWTDDEILPFITDPAYGASAHCRDQSDPVGAGRRQIARAREKQAQDWERTTLGAISVISPRNMRRAFGEMQVSFAHDVFSDRSYLINGDARPQEFSDVADARLRIGVYDRFGFLPNKEVMRDVAVVLAHEAEYHPVKQYLESLTWDGEPRLEEWLIISAGVEDTPYTRAVSKIVLVAACRRIWFPGTKFDQMLVLVDPNQGTNKSSALAALAVRSEWFSDSLPLHANEQKTIEQLQGKWLIECSDLQGMQQADVEALKGFLSRQEDRSRLAYGHHRVNAPRCCVFFGTTNAEGFLRDQQNRRFWPITVRVRIDVDWIVANRDQLWAEARACDLAGESIVLPEHLWKEAEVHQVDRKIGDPWEDVLQQHLTSDVTGRLSNADLYKILDLPARFGKPSDNKRLTEVMRDLGWERKSFHVGYGVVSRGFVKGTEEERKRPVYVYRDEVTGEVSISNSAELSKDQVEAYSRDAAQKKRHIYSEDPFS